MPGGVVIPIPGNIERAIRRMAPEADWGDLRSAAVAYQLARDHSSQSPAAVRAALSGIVERAALLRRDLQMLREESRDAIGDWAVIDATEIQLSRLISASKTGHNETAPRDGRPASLRKGLVRSLAAVLSRSAIQVDGTPNGVLVAITAELLAHYGDMPADVPALVRSAMREN